MTDSGLAEGQISFNVDKTSLVTGDEFVLSAYAPGAQWIEVFFNYKSGDDWENWRDEWGGDSFQSGRRDYWHSGTYQLAARAHYFEADEEGNPLNTDEEGNPEDEWYKDSEPVTITVTAPKGALSVSLPDGLPGYLTPDDSLAFTINMPEDAEAMDVNIWYDPDEEDIDGQLFFENTDDTGKGTIEVTISKEQLAAVGAGKCVKIDMNARAAGYDSDGYYVEIDRKSVV